MLQAMACCGVRVCSHRADIDRALPRLSTIIGLSGAVGLKKFSDALREARECRRAAVIRLTNAVLVISQDQLIGALLSDAMSPSRSAPACIIMLDGDEAFRRAWDVAGLQYALAGITRRLYPASQQEAAMQWAEEEAALRNPMRRAPANYYRP